MVLEQRALLLVLSVGAVGTAGDPSVIEPGVVGVVGVAAEGAVVGVGCWSGGHRR